MGEVTFKTPQEVADERLQGWRESAKVSAFQAKAALKRAGRLAEVKTLIAGLDEDDETRIAWENATEFRRQSPNILAIAQQLSMSDSDLDDLFEQAAAIEA